MIITATKIADTTWNGARIITLHCRYPRFIHAQVMTHRVFSRSARSSRAVPVRVMIEDAMRTPVLPKFAVNKRGMQPGKVLANQQAALEIWRTQFNRAITAADELARLGVHKQWANRILEPFAHIDTLITSTDWANFFHLRIHKDTQNEHTRLARAMLDAIRSSEPVESPTHSPYHDDWQVSAARCARVSYKPFNATEADEDADRRLAAKLYADRHLSPFEHQAQWEPGRHANFHSWRSQRHMLGLETRRFEEFEI